MTVPGRIKDTLPEVEEADLTNLCLDKVQMDWAVNSGELSHSRNIKFLTATSEFTFILTPVKHSIEIE